MSTESKKFHSLAKDAGNRLRAYILSVSSGATAVFFFTLTNNEASKFTTCEKWLIIIGLLGFVSTAAISLYELSIDSQRFFYLAKETEKEEIEQNWTKNEKYKTLRYWLIHSSYVTFGVGVIATSIYLIIKVSNT